MIKLKKDSVILFYGDSITDGGRGRTMDGNHILGHGYQYIISAKLAMDNIKNSPKFINKGNSSESVGQLYARLNPDVLKYKPDIVSILVGINDVFKAEGLPLGRASEKYIEIYKMMIDDIRDILPQTQIIVCEPFYLELDNKENPYKNTPYVMCEQDFQSMHLMHDDEFKNRIRSELTIMQNLLIKMTQEKGVIYVPLQEEFFEYSKKISPEYIVWDETHPTVAGHEIIARKWLDVVEKNIK